MLRLMHVHAHPDDESSKGAATTAKYVAEGVDVHVVTCTGGERGSILNPRWTAPRCCENITEIRREEMERARDILGVRQDWLGFVDSGWPEGDPLPPLPEGCFALVPLEEAAEPLVRLIREFRPHVMTTYDENGGYPHPDHIRCHEVTVAAFEAAGDPERYPDAGEPWQPLKLYYHHWFHRRAHRRAARGDARRTASSRRTPSGSRSGSRDPERDARLTTRVPCAEYFAVRDQALLAHATQIDPDGAWFAMPAARSSRRPGRPRTTSWSRSHVETTTARGRPVRRRPRGLAERHGDMRHPASDDATRCWCIARSPTRRPDPEDVKAGWLGVRRVHRPGRRGRLPRRQPQQAAAQGPGRRGRRRVRREEVR